MKSEKGHRGQAELRLLLDINDAKYVAEIHRDIWSMTGEVIGLSRTTRLWDLSYGFFATNVY